MGEETEKWVNQTFFTLQSLPDLEVGWMRSLFLLIAPPAEPV